MTEQPVPPRRSAAPSAVPAGSSSRVPARRLRWLVPPAVILFVVLIVRGLFYAPFYIPSGSMEPTLEVGDRILVDRTIEPSDLRRGDVIVFDAAAAFHLPEPDHGLVSRILDVVGGLVGRGPETDYVKRVIGLPGDHVVCCNPSGRLLVNGAPLEEPYLYPGDAASDLRFDIVVPPGKFWVMGDHRSDSSDSRAHLGAPGGGTVPGEDIIGQVRVRYWPPGRAGGLGSTASLPHRSNGQ